MMEISFLYYSIIVINALVFLSGRKVKLIYIPSAIFLILFVMGKRFNDNFIAYDLRVYQRGYEDVANYFTFEVGFKLLDIVGNAFGLNFEQFYMILVACTMTTILVAVKKIGGNVHLFIMSWLIYFVLISMDQLRNQLALAIMMVAMLPFFSNNQKSLRNELIVVGIATLFHISFILFVIPLILTYKKNMDFGIKWIIICVILYFGMMLTSAYDVLHSLINSFVTSFENTSKYEEYTSSHTSLSSLYSFGIYLIVLIGLYLHRRKNTHNKGPKFHYAYENINMFLLFCIFSSMLLSFLLVNAAFYRYIRDLSFICIAYLGINSTQKSTSFIYRLQTLAFTLLISIGWFVFDIIIKGYSYDYNRFFFDNEIIK